MGKDVMVCDVVKINDIGKKPPERSQEERQQCFDRLTETLFFVVRLKSLIEQRPGFIPDEVEVDGANVNAQEYLSKALGVVQDALLKSVSGQ